MRFTWIPIALSLAASSVAFAHGTGEAATEQKPLAIGCYLDQMVRDQTSPDRVKGSGKRIKIFMLVQDSVQTRKSVVMAFDDRSRVLDGASFTRFEYVPGQASKYILWTTEIDDPRNVALQVDTSKPDQTNAVMAKNPDDPSFRYVGTCLSLRTKDAMADFEWMKGQ